MCCMCFSYNQSNFRMLPSANESLAVCVSHCPSVGIHLHTLFRCPTHPPPHVVHVPHTPTSTCCSCAPHTKGIGTAVAGAAMATALFCCSLNIHYHFWQHGCGHESVDNLTIALSALRPQSSPTTRIQVPQKRIQLANESEAVVPRFVVQQWSWLKLAQNPPQKS